MKRNLTVAIAELIPRILHLKAQVTLNEPMLMSQSGECANSHDRKSVCVCSQGGAGASIRLLI
jgi:hypothetical protein